jgi:hypothetical protein
MKQTRVLYCTACGEVCKMNRHGEAQFGRYVGAGYTPEPRCSRQCADAPITTKGRDSGEQIRQGGSHDSVTKNSSLAGGH